MSPLWRDQIRIALCPDKVVLVRLARGWRPQIADKQIIPCVGAPSGEAPWQLPLMALKEALPAFCSRSADAHTILSNGFVRYALVPWNAQLTGEEELAYVRHCFAKTYGDSGNHWMVRLSPDMPGASQIASAVNQRLLDQLTSTIRECGLRPGSVQPYLMAAFNQWRPHFTGTTAWFALVEGGRLCLALFHHDRWLSLRILKSGPAWREEFPLTLNREQHLVDLPETPRKVFLCAPEETEIAMTMDDTWIIQRLVLPPQPGFVPQAEAAYSLAVGG